MVGSASHPAEGGSMYGSPNGKDSNNNNEHSDTADTSGKNMLPTDENCSVCSKPFEDPRLLTCMHSCCVKCLKRTEDERHVACAVCGQLTSLPAHELATTGPKSMKSHLLLVPNYMVQSESKDPIEKQEHLCVDCGLEDPLPATYYCKTENKHRCEFHHPLTHRTPATKAHEVVSVQLPSANIGKKNVECLAHPGKPIEFWCKKCKEIACAHCLLAPAHKQHDVVPIEEGSADMMKPMANLWSELENTKNRCKDVLDNTVALEEDFKRQCNAIRSELKKHFFLLQEAIYAQEAKILQELDAVSESTGNRFLNRKRRLYAISSSLDRALRANQGIQKLKEEGRSAHFLSLVAPYGPVVIENCVNQRMALAELLVPPKLVFKRHNLEGQKSLLQENQLLVEEMQPQPQQPSQHKRSNSSGSNESQPASTPSRRSASVSYVPNTTTTTTTTTTTNTNSNNNNNQQDKINNEPNTPRPPFTPAHPPSIVRKDSGFPDLRKGLPALEPRSNGHMTVAEVAQVSPRHKRSASTEYQKAAPPNSERSSPLSGRRSLSVSLESEETNREAPAPDRSHHRNSIGSTLDVAKRAEAASTEPNRRHSFMASPSPSLSSSPTSVGSPSRTPLQAPGKRLTPTPTRALVTTICEAVAAPRCIAVLKGVIYCSSACMLKKIVKGAVTDYAGSATPGYADGDVAEARFGDIHGIAFDQLVNMYVVDTTHHRIRKITPQGVVSTFVGTGIPGLVDGVGTEAQINYPTGIGFSRATKMLYICDLNTIKAIDLQGKVTTLAGDAEKGFADGAGRKARFHLPWGIHIVDSVGGGGVKGFMLVPEYGNHRIRKVSFSGDVMTVAGSGEKGYEDGPALSSKFYRPISITMNNQGHCFIVDQYNARIRMVEMTGKISTIVGASGQGNVDGTGDKAKLSVPWGITVFEDGATLLLADYGNNAIKMIRFKE